MNTRELNPGANRHLQAVSRLEAVAASDGTFPLLKLAVNKALDIVQIIEKFNSNKRAWITSSNSFIGKVEEIIWYTSQFHKDQVPSALQLWLEDLKGTLDHLKESVSDIHQQSLWKFLSFEQDKEYIEKFEKKVNEAMSSFDVLFRYEKYSQSDSTKTADQVRTTEAYQDDTTAAQVTVFAGAQDIQMDHSVIIAGQVVHYNNMEELQEKIQGSIEESKESHVDKWLQELKASLHSKPSERCMAGTRVDVLKDIEAWVNDLSMPNILWLSGSPGSGKTTVASTVVACFECFSGQFFFHRDQAELRNPHNLWRCLALDLAQGNVALKIFIAQALKAQKANIRGLDIFMQFEHLIVKPLQKVSQSSVKPLLLVIDALDECDSYEKLLPSLKSCSQLSKSLKLLVTSRRHSDIQNALKPVSYHIDLHAGGEVSDQTANDLWKYFTTRFLEGTKLHTSALYLNWPGLEKISFLVEKAAGLFIWARSAMDFILYKGGDIQERLEVICSNSGEGIDAIDSLYHQIISAAFQGLRQTEKNYLLSVLGSIVIARNPLRFSDLEQLLGVRDALSIISQLSPVLSISETGHVQICHQSVTDFLLAPERSQAFWVDSQKYSLCLAGYCLKFMNTVLRFNFFDLETSHVLNKDIPGLENHIESVKSTALDHASHFWAIYLQRSSNEALQWEVMFQIEKFLMDHLLHWLEVMSLRGTVNHAAQSVLLAASWSRTSNPTISDFANDANRFIMEFIEPISTAAPHIYVSALPFAPKDSRISMHFLKQFQRTLKVQTGQMKNWSDRSFLILEGHSSSVNSVAFSSDGKHIVSGSTDKTVRVWDSLSGQSVTKPLIGHNDEVCSVVFSPDGRHIVSGSCDKTIRVWKTYTGQSVMNPIRGHYDEVYAVAYSPDGQNIVSGSGDKTVRIWNVQTGQTIMDPLRGHEDKVYSVAFSFDGRHIISGSGDGTVRVWDFQTGHSLMSLLAGQNDGVYSIAFSPDGKYIASGSAKQKVRVWEAATGQIVMETVGACPPSSSAVAFAPDGRHVVSVSDFLKIQVWDTQTGQCVLSPRQSNHLYSSVAFSPCGRHIVFGVKDGTVRVWDALIGQSGMDPVSAHDNTIVTVAFSPDGRSIASGSRGKTIRVWDALTGQSIMDPLRGHNGPIHSVVYSPDGRYIASGSFDRTVRVWDAQTGQSVMAPLTGHWGTVTSVAFSPDCNYIVSGSCDITIRVWSIQTGRSTISPLKGHDHWVTSVAFSPNGRHIVSGSQDCTIRIWDAWTGQSVTLSGHSDFVTSVAFSSDGGRIVSGSWDDTVRVWDAQKGQIMMGPLKGHDGAVTSVAFSPDGRYITSGSFDRTVRVWDAQTGQSVMAALTGHDSLVESVAFSPDGRRIVSGSHDKTIRIWDARIDQSVVGNSAHTEAVVDGDHMVFRYDKNTVRLVSHDSWLSIAQTVQSHVDPAMHHTLVTSPYMLFQAEAVNNVNKTSIYHTLFHDFYGAPVIFKPEGRWMMGEDHCSHLFWVPQLNRTGLFWPRTVAVFGTNPTSIDFNNFTHGKNWSHCILQA